MSMDFIIITLITAIIMCINICLDVRNFREEKEEDESLTARRYLRENPSTPISVVYYLFLVISYSICILLKNKGVNLNEVALGIFYIITYILVVILRRYLVKTKDDK